MIRSARVGSKPSALAMILASASGPMTPLAMTRVRLPVSSSSMASSALLAPASLRLHSTGTARQPRLFGSWSALRGEVTTAGSQVQAVTGLASPTVSFNGLGWMKSESAGAGCWADSAPEPSSWAMTSAGVSTSDDISRKA